MSEVLEPVAIWRRVGLSSGTSAVGLFLITGVLKKVPALRISFWGPMADLSWTDSLGLAGLLWIGVFFLFMGIVVLAEAIHMTLAFLDGGKHA